MSSLTFNAEMPPRDLSRVYHLDANRINARKRDIYVNQLEKWHEDCVIFLEMSEKAWEKAGRGSSTRQAKSDEYTFAIPNDSIGGEQVLRSKIEKIVFPKGATKRNQINDIYILFTAHRAGATLITEDGDSKRQPHGILGNSARLKKIGIEVLSTREAVSEIDALIKDRDNMARNVARAKGIDVPVWVDQDLSRIAVPTHKPLVK